MSLVRLCAKGLWIAYAKLQPRTCGSATTCMASGARARRPPQHPASCRAHVVVCALHSVRADPAHCAHEDSVSPEVFDLEL